MLNWKLLITSSWVVIDPKGFGLDLTYLFLSLIIPTSIFQIGYILNTQTDRTIIQITALTYNIWHGRNQAIFENLFVPEMTIIQCAQNNILAFQQATLKTHECTLSASAAKQPLHGRTSRRRDARCSCWKTPHINLLKANCDANLQVPDIWGLGCIIRNKFGMAKVTATWCRNGFDCATTAEAYAILAAMFLAKT